MGDSSSLGMTVTPGALLRSLCSGSRRCCVQKASTRLCRGALHYKTTRSTRCRGWVLSRDPHSFIIHICKCCRLGEAIRDLRLQHLCSPLCESCSPRDQPATDSGCGS
jgi:hypothetical protein